MGQAEMLSYAAQALYEQEIIEQALYEQDMIDNFVNELAWQAEIAVIENEMQAQKAAYDKQEMLKQIEMAFGAEIAGEAKAEIKAAEEATEGMSEAKKSLITKES